MGRFIHCPVCKEANEKAAASHGELYEFIEGAAVREMFCDGGYCPGNPTQIKAGEICFAACMLPNKEHRNYVLQKPKVWANLFIVETEKAEAK